MARLKEAFVKDLLKQVIAEDISFSRFVERLNEEANIGRESPVLEIKISKFIEDCSQVSIRTRNCLVEYMKQHGDIDIRNVMSLEFMKLKHAGKKSSWRK